jgi:hypothetical protein
MATLGMYSESQGPISSRMRRTRSTWSGLVAGGQGTYPTANMSPSPGTLCHFRLQILSTVLTVRASVHAGLAVPCQCPLTPHRAGSWGPGQRSPRMKKCM